MLPLGSLKQDLSPLLIELNKLWTSFVRLFYPANCIFCDQALALEERCYACKNCLDRLPTLKKPLCIKCSSELPPYGPLGPVCGRCQRQKIHFSKGVSLFRYEHAIQHLIQKVKFGKRSWYLQAVASALKRLESTLDFSSYQLIVPVPIDSKRAREREFNQSVLLARILKKEQKINAPIKSVIRKIRNTKPQSALHRDERLHNLAGVFQMKRNAKVYGKKILLVDDVITTGATLNECAKCLTDAGARRVDVLSLARTTYH